MVISGLFLSLHLSSEQLLWLRSLFSAITFTSWSIKINGSYLLYTGMSGKGVSTDAFLVTLWLDYFFVERHQTSINCSVSCIWKSFFSSCVVFFIHSFIVCAALLILPFFMVASVLPRGQNGIDIWESMCCMYICNWAGFDLPGKSLFGTIRCLSQT